MTMMASNWSTWEQEPVVFQCDRCHMWWRTSVPAVSCCVLHSPGSCCHYGQTELDPPQERV